MTTRTLDLSPRRAALTAGWSYVVIFLGAMGAEFLVRSPLVVPGDAAATTANLAAHESLFRAGIVGYLAAAMADLVATVGLYALLRPVHRDLALLAAWFRLAHAVLFGAALRHLLGVLPLLQADGWAAAVPAPQRQAQVMVLLEGYNHEWLVGLVFFAGHLALLGVLVVRSGFVPRVLGWLLGLAALGYVVDSLANFLLIDYAAHADVFLAIVAVPSIVAETGLMIWLLARGGKARAAAS